MNIKRPVPLLLLHALLLQLFAVTGTIAGSNPFSVPGIIDAREWNFKERRLPLNGQWAFFDNQLLTYQECKNMLGTTVKVPTLWNELKPSGEGTGYGTYYVKILAPPSIVTYAFDIPQLYNSYTLSVNGVMVATNGIVGKTKEETIPQWLPQVASFKNTSDTLHLVLQIANFHHHKGGIRETIYLGEAIDIEHHHRIASGSNITEVTILLIAFVAFLILFLQNRDKPIVLCFALLCLTWSARILFSNLYLIISFFPNFNWNAMVKIEYLTLYLLLILTTLFLNHLFKEIGSKLFEYLLITVCVIFIVFTLFTQPIIFTRWLSLYMIVAAITVSYGIFIVAKALILDKAGVWFLVTSLFLGIILIGYDLIAYEGFLTYNIAIASLAHIVIIILITLGLLINLGFVKNNKTITTTLTYKDLYDDDKTR